MTLKLPSALKARTAEAMIGAVLGGSAGAIGGAQTYKTPTPLIWSDEAGAVRGRPMTEQEHAARRKRAGRGALAGAALGALGSPGVSAIRRARLTKAEQAGFNRFTDEFLDPLLDIVKARRKTFRDKYPGEIIKALKASKGSPERKSLKAAKETYAGERKRLQELLEAARANRDAYMWGGPKKAFLAPGGPRFPHPETTLVGSTRAHYPVDPRSQQTQEYFQALVKEMEKNSAFVLRRKAKKITKKLSPREAELPPAPEAATNPWFTGSDNIERD